MSIEYRGEEFLYLVEIPGSEANAGTFRLFNQTGGSTTSDADSIELDTKDKSGSDYGNISQSISIEGVLTEGDIAVSYIRSAQRNKELVKIIEVNTRSLETEEGMYMLSSIGRDFSNGDHATYTIDAELNGDITEGTLQELPEGAPTVGNESSNG